ncbi:MAG: restriction endonuclease subunit S [Thermoguttaceae bacterium]
MSLDTKDWKPFNIRRTKTQSGLFEIVNCKCSSAGELEDGNDINYIGAKKNDNGVMRTVAIDSKLVSKGHGIMFICDGQGSVGYTNYMDKDFIGSTTTSIGYDEALTETNAMFLVTVLDGERFKYSYGRKYRALLDVAQIYLPVQYNLDGTFVIDVSHKYSKDGYIPDWQFMEDYIKSLHHKPLTTKNKNGHTPGLNVQNWKVFDLVSLFGDCESGTRITKDDRIEGCIPFCTAGEFNEGISELIGNPEAKTYCNALSIDMFGNCFYHGYDFKCDDNILVISNDHINEYTGVFISQIISLDKYRNNYGRQYRQNDYEKHKIKLPVDSSGNPDWQFMEDYIKALPYGDRLEG